MRFESERILHDVLRARAEGQHVTNPLVGFSHGSDDVKQATVLAPCVPPLLQKGRGEGDATSLEILPVSTEENCPVIVLLQLRSKINVVKKLVFS